MKEEKDDDDDFGEFEECCVQNGDSRVEEFVMGLPSYRFMLEDRYIWCGNDAW